MSFGWISYVNSLRPSNAYMLRWTNQHWFRLWLVAWSAPSHYLNQCWKIVNWNLRNREQTSVKSLTKIHTFSFKKMHLKISSVKWRPFCLGLLKHPPACCQECGSLACQSWLRATPQCVVASHQFSETRLKFSTSLSDFQENGCICKLYMPCHLSKYN